MLLDMIMSTSTFPNILADTLKRINEQVPKVGAQMLRAIIDAMLPGLMPYVPWFIGLLFLALVIASVKALFGRTGMLGSLLYHIFYFGILGIIVWIKGLEIFFNSYFDLMCFVLYRFCYWLTGLILERFRR